MKNKQYIIFALVLTITLSFSSGYIALAQTSEQSHPAGTLVVNTTGTVFLVTANGKTGIPDLNTFNSYGYSFSDVMPANSADNALPMTGILKPKQTESNQSLQPHAPGTLVNINGEVFLISLGGKLAVTDMNAFNSYGYSFADVVLANAADISLPVTGVLQPKQSDQSLPSSSTVSSIAMGVANPVDNAIQPHPPGTLVNANGMVYLIAPGGRMAIPDLDTFNSWGYSFSDVVIANSADQALAAISFLTKRNGQVSPFVTTLEQQHPPGTLINIDGTVFLLASNGRFAIPDLATFYSYGYSFDQVVPATDADKAVPFGGVLGLKITSQSN